MRLALVASTVVALVATGVLYAAGPPGAPGRALATYPDSQIYALDVSPRDGRLLVAGSEHGYPNNRGFVRAYEADGRPDLGFGASGVVYLDAPARSVADIAVQSDGRIVVLANGGYMDTAATVLRRLRPDGTPDPAFGSGGTAELHPLGAVGVQLALQRGDQILVIVRDGHVVRLSRDGTHDLSYGAAASVRSYHQQIGGAIQPDDGLVLTWPDDNYVTRIARVSPDGRLDSSFGGEGGVQFARAEWAARARYPMMSLQAVPPLVLPDGRIRVPLRFQASRTEPPRMAIAGLTGTGHPDRSFGDRGFAIGPPASRRGGEEAGVLVVDRRGSVVVAGMAWGTVDFDFGAPLVRRFEADGELDRSFRAITLGGFLGDLELLDRDTLAVGSYAYDPKYAFWGSAYVGTIHAGYDRDAPAIRLRAGCHWLRVRVRDISALDRVVLRIDGRVARRTTRKKLRLRVRPGLRVSATAVDVAGNRARGKTIVPPC